MEPASGLEPVGAANAVTTKAAAEATMMSPSSGRRGGRGFEELRLQQHQSPCALNVAWVIELRNLAGSKANLVTVAGITRVAAVRTMVRWGSFPGGV